MKIKLNFDVDFVKAIDVTKNQYVMKVNTSKSNNIETREYIITKIPAQKSFMRYVQIVTDFFVRLFERVFMNVQYSEKGIAQLIGQDSLKISQEQIDLLNSAYDSIFPNSSCYPFSFHTNKNQDLLLGDLRGKVIVIVNTASNCGFTKQYKDLQELYLKYKDKGLVVIGAPSNEFKNQEPGSDEEIAQFCQRNFGVTFPIVKKLETKGDHSHPFYAWARDKLGFINAPKWNFHKYIIDRNGRLVDHFFSNQSPASSNFIKKIEELL